MCYRGINNLFTIISYNCFAELNVVIVFVITAIVVGPHYTADIRFDIIICICKKKYQRPKDTL